MLGTSAMTINSRRVGKMGSGVKGRLYEQLHEDKDFKEKHLYRNFISNLSACSFITFSHIFKNKMTLSSLAIFSSLTF